MYRARSASSTGRALSANAVDPPAPSFSSIAVRARNNALLAPATLISRASAVSSADRPTTSRKSSVARCGADRHCSAATNASATLSFNEYRAPGSVVAAPASHVSGIGSSHTGSSMGGVMGPRGSAAGG